MNTHEEIINNLGIPREEYLRSIRINQPIDELRRKADKARRKDIWTEEDLDLAAAEAMEICTELKWQCGDGRLWYLNT